MWCKKTQMRCSTQILYQWKAEERKQKLKEFFVDYMKMSDRVYKLYEPILYRLIISTDNGYIEYVCAGYDEIQASF